MYAVCMTYVLSGCFHVTFRTQGHRPLLMSLQPESKVNLLTNQREIEHVSHFHHQPAIIITLNFRKIFCACHSSYLILIKVSIKVYT